MDEAKNRRNIANHKISLETVQSVFEDPDLLSLYDRLAGSEERWHAFGLIDGVIVVLVVHA